MNVQKNLRNTLFALGLALAGLVGVADSANAATGDRAATSRVGDKNTATVGDGLLQFEANIKWAAVSGSWAGQRAGWIAGVRAAKTPGDVAQKVLSLETSMGWGAVEDAWKSRRSGWVSELSGAKSDAQVAKLLMELEANTKWSAVESTWAPIRSGWMAKLRGV